MNEQQIEELLKHLASIAKSLRVLEHVTDTIGKTKEGDSFIRVVGEMDTWNIT